MAFAYGPVKAQGGARSGPDLWSRPVLDLSFLSPGLTGRPLKRLSTSLP